jgi:hypothetical protein
MNLEKILITSKKKDYLIIQEEDLKELLSQSKIILEKDTHISDKIRLLKINGELIIQEKSNKDELIIRIMKTKKEAEEFIKQRLEIYDRMWDGCGCKVEYYI